MLTGFALVFVALPFGESLVAANLDVGVFYVVSVTALEFSYTQAPQTLKSMVMSIYLLSVSLGNWLTAGINYAITTPDGGTRLDGAGYYRFFAALMFVAALGFLFISRTYKERLVLQSREG